MDIDPKTRLWSLYWIASNTGAIDPPVVGSFENGIGHFFGKDTFKGKPIIVVFLWDARNKERPLWGQAFSADNARLGNGISLTFRKDLRSSQLESQLILFSLG